MADIVFSPKAIADLKRVKTYIAEELNNEQAALNTVSKITRRIRQLAEFPEMGAPLSSVVDFTTNYRFLICGRYTSFYRYDDQIVYIVRIIYGRRDFMRILFDE